MIFSHQDTRQCNNVVHGDDGEPLENLDSTGLYIYLPLVRTREQKEALNETYLGRLYRVVLDNQ